MSRRRSISTGISLDRLINQLARESGDFAALLYTWMIPHAEDAACITGDVEELALTVCPGFRHKTEADVETALEAMDRIGLVAWDREACTIYFDSESFYRHQSYIPTAKRVDNSEHFHQRRKKATNAEKKPRTPQNAASLSLSLSPSLTRSRALVDADAPTGAENNAIASDFEGWWERYGRVGSKADALDLFRWWRTTGGASTEDLLTAAVAYRDHCAATDCKMAHARTFLAKPAKGKSARWPEWAAGEAHGAMDAQPTKRRNLCPKCEACLASDGDGTDNVHCPVCGWK